MKAIQNRTTQPFDYDFTSRHDVSSGIKNTEGPPGGQLSGAPVRNLQVTNFQMSNFLVGNQEIGSWKFGAPRDLKRNTIQKKIRSYQMWYILSDLMQIYKHNKFSNFFCFEITLQTHIFQRIGISLFINFMLYLFSSGISISLIYITNLFHIESFRTK